MASMPLYWQPPPATEVPQDSSSSTSSEYSTNIGPFIAVLIVVTVLCVVASVIGRLCSGKTILGYGDYDMERWAESRCGSCIDGDIIPHRPSPAQSRQPLQHTSSSGVSNESEGHVVDLDETTDGEKQESLDNETPPPQQTPSS